MSIGEVYSLRQWRTDKGIGRLVLVTRIRYTLLTKYLFFLLRQFQLLVRAWHYLYYYLVVAVLLKNVATHAKVSVVFHLT